MRHRPLGVEGKRRRADELAPLFEWMLAHGHVQSRVVRLAFMRHDADVISRGYANQIKRGDAPAPTWLIEECLAVMGVSREQVFGSGASDAAAPADQPAQATQAGATAALADWDVA